MLLFMQINILYNQKVMYPFNGLELNYFTILAILTQLDLDFELVLTQLDSYRSIFGTIPYHEYTLEELKIEIPELFYTP